MKNFLNMKFVKWLLPVLVSVLLGTGIVVYAGSITPPSGTPSAQFYTLSEIYNFITSNTPATEGGHSFTFSDSLASSGKTLSEIYNALASLISADKVKTGTTYLGVAGTLLPSGGTATTSEVLSGRTYFGDSQTDWSFQTGTMPNIGQQLFTPNTNNQTISQGYHDGTGYVEGDTDLIASNILADKNVFGVVGTSLKNLWNGTRTDGGFDGGSQANGGNDDYNNAKAPPVDRYATSWTICDVANNYCGTGDDGAYIKDDAVNLIWSHPCKNAGCSEFSNVSPSTYTWTASSSATYDRSYSVVNAGIVDASILCSNGDHQKSGWYLPHQKQLMQAYINGSYGNLEASGVNRYYWSATTLSYNTALAWYTNLSFGLTNPYSKLTGLSFIRCVRPGI